MLRPTGISALVLWIAALAAAQEGPRYAHDGPALISNVRVIDGLGNDPVDNQDLLIVDGAISEIGPGGSLEAPAGALGIDGSGLTAMPGLVDMHIHLKGSWANGTLPGEEYGPTYDDDSVQQALAGYLYAGVTTILDAGNDHEWILQMRTRINSGDLAGPRFFAVGATWSQAPSGWDAFNETPFDASTKITSIEGIGEQLDRYVEDDIEIIKLYSGISPHAAQFLVTEAHARGIKTMADFWSLNLDKLIMQATGLDGWAHTGGFEIVSNDNNEWMAANDRFVIVTANVGEKLSGLRVRDENGQRTMLNEPLIVDIWGEATVVDFYEKYPQVREGFYDGPESFYQQNDFGDMTRFRENFLVNIKRSFDAGVLIAGGSDTPFPSLWPGESMHRELELLVMAGISAIDAIKICTYNASKILQREDEFGSLQKGLSADILLVEGNPAENISDSRNVRHVFLRGKQVDRDSLKLKH